MKEMAMLRVSAETKKVSDEYSISPIKVSKKPVKKIWIETNKPIVIKTIIRNAEK